jgi:cytochrome P450
MLSSLSLIVFSVITTAKDVEMFHSDTKQHLKSGSSNAGWLFHQLLGRCLGLLNHEEWKHSRKAFEPAFTHRAVGLRKCEIVLEAKKYVNNLVSKDQMTPIDISTLLKPYTFWCASTLVYGPLSEMERKRLWTIAMERASLFGNVLNGGVYCTFLLRWFDRNVYTRLLSFQQEWRSFNEEMLHTRISSTPNTLMVAINRSLWKSAGDIDIVSHRRFSSRY